MDLEMRLHSRHYLLLKEREEEEEEERECMGKPRTFYQGKILELAKRKERESQEDLLSDGF